MILDDGAGDQPSNWNNKTKSHIDLKAGRGRTNGRRKNPYARELEAKPRPGNRNSLPES